LKETTWVQYSATSGRFRHSLQGEKSRLCSRFKFFKEFHVSDAPS
jgi:hypothetical protein